MPQQTAELKVHVDVFQIETTNTGPFLHAPSFQVEPPTRDLDLHIVVCPRLRDSATVQCKPPILQCGDGLPIQTHLVLQEKGLRSWERMSELKKRIKSVCISNAYLFVDDELGISPLPAQSLPVSSKITSIFGSRYTHKVPKPKIRHLTPPETIREHVLDVLNGAENLEELRIIGRHGPRWGSGSGLLHPVSAALTNRQSLRKLYLEGSRLDMVLPLVQFHGLKDVTVAFSFSSELWPSMEAVVRHVAPSVEILHLSASDRGPSCSISLPITEILCDDGKAHAPPIALMMPNLRELTAPLRVSPYPTRVFNTMNVKYSSLTKLGLHLHTEDGLLNVPLCSLRLPHLRTLWLSFASVDPAPGIWSGRYEFTELREFRIKGRHDSGRGGLDVSVLCGDDVSLPLSQSVRPRWGTLDSAFRLSSGAP